MRNDFETGYLEHSALGTTWKKKGAKYLSRVWKNGRWVYFYKTGIKKFYDKKHMNDGHLKYQSKDALNNYKKYKQEAQNIRDEKTGHGVSYYKDKSGTTHMNVDWGARKTAEKTAEYNAYKAYREAERKGRDAAYYQHDQKMNDHKIAYAIKNGKKKISDILSKFKTTETVTISSNLYPAGTKKVIKKK